MTADQQSCQAVDASDVGRDVEMTQAFLSWAREQGYSFDTVTIGRVQLIGTRDLLPSISAQARAVGDAERRASLEGGDDSVYASMPGAERFPVGTRPG